MKSAVGYHIFKVEEIRPAKPADFAQVQGDVVAAILSDKIAKAWPSYIQELRSKAKIVTTTAR